MKFIDHCCMAMRPRSKMAEPYASIAAEFASEMIHSAVQRLAHPDGERAEYYLEEAEDIDWPTGADFTQEVGLKSVEEFIGRWQLHACWKYCINYLGVDGERYKYQVVWSIPTRRKPIPRATASVYFTLVLQQKVRLTDPPHLWSNTTS